MMNAGSQVRASNRKFEKWLPGPTNSPDQTRRFLVFFGVISKVMRRSINLLLGFAAILVVAASVGATRKGANAAIVGVWRGEFENLSAATLNITDEAGPLQGAVLFYLIRRDEGTRQHHRLGSRSHYLI